MIVNKGVQNAVLGCSLKKERMISVHFQGKPFNITVIQVYAPTSNTEEAEAKLKKAGFEVAIETVKEENASVEKGDVIKTEPQAERTIKKGLFFLELFLH